MTDAVAPDMTAEPDLLVWIDLEMTGLDVRRHTIVEIAVLLTDSELNVIADGLDLIVHATAEDLAEMDDFVTKMHTRSGLLTAIQESQITLKEAGAQALQYIAKYVTQAGTAPLCGNSIGVDRRFLDCQLQELDAYLHYRSIDVSSFKELCRRWNPAVYANRPKKMETHRALDDIRESVEELRYYREHMLTKES